MGLIYIGPVMFGITIRSKYGISRLPSLYLKDSKSKILIVEDEREISKRHPGGFIGYMAPLEAVKILGLKDYTDSTEINRAYENMMEINDPQKGGSEYIREKVEEARNI